MSILINKNTRVMTQGITGKTGQFHTRMGKEYANGANCYVAGVNPKKPRESLEGIPIFATVKEAKEKTGATVSVIYVPPPFAYFLHILVWNWPVLPVMPCVITRVFLLMRMDIRSFPSPLLTRLRLRRRLSARHPPCSRPK